MENNVIVLGALDFDAFISHHEYCLVVFYTPWSHKSQELMPEYEAVALELQNEMPPVPIAKVDVQQYPELVQRYHLHELPSCNFFIRKKTHNLFINKPEMQKILDFVRKMRAPHSQLVKDESSLEMLNAHHKLVVGYFGLRNDKYSAYQAATLAFEDVLFVHSEDPEFRENIGHSLVLFKNYED